MNVCILGDIHFGVRNDSLFFLENQIQCLDFVVDYLIKNDIKAVIQLGDIFDRRKYINFQTLHIAHQRFFKSLEKNGIQLFVVIGNHDTFFKNTNEINSPELLLSGFSNTRMINCPTTLEFSNTSFAVVPWINSSNYSDSMQFIRETSAHILLGHFEVKDFGVLCGEDFHDGVDIGVFSKFDRVFSGHYHNRVERSGFSYIGNISQITWSDLDISKFFVVFNCETGDHNYIEIPVTAFKKVEYSEDIDILTFDYSPFTNKIVKVTIQSFETISRRKFDLFIEKLNQVAQNVDVIENSIDFWTTDDISLDFDSDVDTLRLLETQVSSIIQDENIDKAKVIGDIRALFSEALAFGAEE